MTDFLFHKVSEEEKEEIKEQAKKILEDFSKKLETVKEEIPTSLIEREESERAEIKNAVCEKGFRERMFENAPNKNKDSIIAEKKNW